MPSLSVKRMTWFSNLPIMLVYKKHKKQNLSFFTLGWSIRIVLGSHSWPGPFGNFQGPSQGHPPAQEIRQPYWWVKVVDNPLIRPYFFKAGGPIGRVPFEKSCTHDIPSISHPYPQHQKKNNPLTPNTHRKLLL